MCVCVFVCGNSTLVAHTPRLDPHVRITYMTAYHTNRHKHVHTRHTMTYSQITVKHGIFSGPNAWTVLL